MSEIMLDREHGVNPFLTYCVRCVKVHGRNPDRLAPKETRAHDGPGLVLMGCRDYVDICNSCGMQHFGGAKKKAHSQPYSGSRECVKCGNDTFHRRKLSQYERIPSSEPCEECKKEIEAENTQKREILEGGGIFVKCKDCGMEAMLRGDHELAKEVRAKMKIDPPLPCGLEINQKECPMCRTEN